MTPGLGRAKGCPAAWGPLRPAEPRPGIVVPIDNQPTDPFNSLSGEAT